MTAVIVSTALILSPHSPFAPASAESGPVLIIDAGHGGEDGGAVAPDGTLESNINLDIALRLKALADFWGIETVMTRSTSDLPYPPEAETLSAKKKADQNERLELINRTPDGILLSIHQNFYPADSPWGIQVFYGQESGSNIFAAKLQENMTAQLCPENKRLAEAIGDEIYLMRRAACPAVLVECGFLSNPSDREKLCSESYQTELAAVMLSSYLQYIRGNPI